MSAFTHSVIRLLNPAENALNRPLEYAARPDTTIVYLGLRFAVEKRREIWKFRNQMT